MVDALRCRGAAARVTFGLGGRRRCVGGPAQQLDEGEGDQQQPGQEQDDLAGGLAPEHQRQASQDHGPDAQGLLVGVDQLPTP
jgi:hypothetical protein